APNPLISTAEPAIVAARLGMKPIRCSSAVSAGLAASGAESRVWTWNSCCVVMSRSSAGPQFPAREVRPHSPAGYRPTVTAVKAKDRPAVGQLLQYWRQVRRMSQLALATEARVTP